MQIVKGNPKLPLSTTPWSMKCFVLLDLRGFILSIKITCVFKSLCYRAVIQHFNKGLNVDIELTTHRRSRFRTPEEKQITIFTKTTKNNHYGGGLYDIKYYNCIYMTFLKEDFPNLAYPKLVKGYREGTKRFDYMNYNECSLANLGWYKGITFYKEEQDIESGKIIVTAGADYQHHGDEEYMSNDCGEMILKVEAENLFKEFVELNKVGN